MKYGFLLPKSLAFVLLASLSGMAYAQKNLVPGIVVTFTNDTIKGRIDYREWNTNPDRISFTDETGRIMIMTPLDIERFTVMDETYVSAIVTTENSSTSLVSLQEIPDFNLGVDTVFLRALAEGNKSLYFLRNRSGNNNFYIRDDEGYTLLLYKRYIITTGSGKIVAEEKEYINQLLDYFSDNTGIKGQIAATGYNRESLERLFRQHYSMSGSSVKISGKPSKVKVKAGLFTGITLTRIKLHSDYYQYLDKTDYPISANFTGGLGVDIISDRNFGRWSFNNEIQWSSWGASGDQVISSESGATVYTYLYDLSFSYLNINSMLRFNYPAGRAILFLNAGMSNGFIVSQENYMQYELKDLTGIETGEGEYVADIRRYEQALLLGGGIRYGKFCLEYRHEMGNGISINMEIFSATRINTIWLGYSF